VFALSLLDVKYCCHEWYLTCGSVNKLNDFGSLCMSSTTSFKRDSDNASMSISFLILIKKKQVHDYSIPWDNTTWCCDGNPFLHYIFMVRIR
jgi:hypothetical protein